MVGTREISGRFYTLYERYSYTTDNAKARAQETAARMRERGYYARVVKWNFGKTYLDDFAVYIFPKD